MSKDLKSENIKQVYWLLMLPIIVSALIQLGVTSTGEAKWDLLKIEGVIGAILYALALTLTNLLPQNLKHKLVFTRLRHEMPASRVHKLVRADPRIDIEAAATKWPAVFANETDENTRNSLWYRNIYKPVRESSPVRQTHRTFLLFRDVTSGLVFFLIASLAWLALGASNVAPTLNAAVPLVMFMFTTLSLIAARNAGNRLVVNAVAEAL